MGGVVRFIMEETVQKAMFMLNLCFSLCHFQFTVHVNHGYSSATLSPSSGAGINHGSTAAAPQQFQTVTAMRRHFQSEANLTSAASMAAAMPSANQR